MASTGPSPLRALVLQPGFYVRLKKSQTESIAGLYGHALPAPANMLISYMANRKPGCSTSTLEPGARRSHDGAPCAADRQPEPTPGLGPTSVPAPSPEP